MPDNDQPKPTSPWRLNSGRVVLLALGALLLIYMLSAMFGGLTNYQQLKEAAQDQQLSTSPAAPAEPAVPAN